MKRYFKPLAIFQALVIGYILLPMVIIVLVSFTDRNYISLPAQTLSIKWYIEVFHRPEFGRALAISFSLAIIVGILSTILGTTGAIVITRYKFAGRSILDTIFMTPLMVPAIVSGIALLQFFSHFHLHSYYMLIIGHVIITIPYSVRTVSACFQNFDRNLELAAMNLGAGWFYTFRTITIPLIRPGLFAGLIFAFIISFGDATISVFLVWSDTVTLPVEIFNRLRQLSDPAVAAISTLTILLSIVLIFVLEKSFGLKRLF